MTRACHCAECAAGWFYDPHVDTDNESEGQYIEYTDMIQDRLSDEADL